MKQIHNRYVINQYACGVFVILAVVIAVYIVFTIQNDPAEGVASQKSESIQSNKSQFSFTGAPGWRQGPSNETSMALFHGHDCFVSTEYKPGTVTVSARLQKIQTDLTSMGYTITPNETLTIELRSNEGPKQYQLHQYAVAGVGSAGQVKGAQEYGYLQLSDGYVEIEGYCDATDQLPATLPALQAIKFNASN